jgi:hypothetical protein
MAWQIGPFAVRTGTSVTIGFWWDEDPGVQAIQVLPIVTSIGGGFLELSGELELTSLSIENEPRPRAAGRRITYRVVVTHHRHRYWLPADPVEFVIRGAEV